MGANSSHDWQPELLDLCAEGEEVGDKKFPREHHPSDIKRKNKFSSATFYGSMREVIVKGTADGSGKTRRPSASKRRRSTIPASAMSIVVNKEFKRGDKCRELLRGCAQHAQLPEVDHVVSLLGVVSSKSSISRLVFSYCNCGPLDQYLKLKTGLGTTDKLKILAHVSDGMAELEALGFVHGALRTANVYVAEGGQIFKVGCWGPRERDTRWMAPESVTSGKYNHQSDVWSFALIAQDVFNDGNGAVSDRWTSKHAGEQFAKGWRPARVDTCDTNTYSVISKCWSADPSCRPDFFWLRSELEDLSVAVVADAN